MDDNKFEELKQRLRGQIEEDWPRKNINGDGYIDRDEARKMVLEETGSDVKPEEAEAKVDDLMATMGSNGDGRISKEECFSLFLGILKLKKFQMRLQTSSEQLQ